jgi:hypothetical protein
MMENNWLVFIIIILLYPIIYWCFKLFYLKYKADDKNIKKDIINFTLIVWLVIVIFMYNIVNYSIYENNIKYNSYKHEVLELLDYNTFVNKYDIDKVKSLDKKCIDLEVSFCNIFNEYMLLKEKSLNNTWIEKSKIEFELWTFNFWVKSWFYWKIKKEKNFVLGLSNLYKIFIEK